VGAEGFAAVGEGFFAGNHVEGGVAELVDGFGVYDLGVGLWWGKEGVRLGCLIGVFGVWCVVCGKWCEGVKDKAYRE
jgi:hypothetical protein